LKYSWDHTIQHVNNLEKSIDVFGAHGLKVFMGGSHTNWGTYNALSYFGLCYIEFLGIENLNLAKQVEEPILFVKDCLELLPDHEVFGRVALRTDDIEKAAQLLKEESLAVSDIFEGKRRNAQGQLIEWKMLMLEGDFEGLLYPFIIQWRDSDDSRKKNLMDAGAICPHPIGSVDISSAIFSIKNPAETASHWSKLFGFPVEHIDDQSSLLSVNGQSFLFQKGAANRLTEFLFTTDNQAMKGRTITLGSAIYRFI
jgi:Glyoxalase-like domain